MVRPRFVLAIVTLVASTLAIPAQVVVQLTDTRTSLPGPPALDDAGASVFSGTSTDQFGANPEHAFQVVKWDAAGGTGAPVTTRPGGVTPLVSVSDDGQWLAFPSTADLVGRNHDASAELFVMRTDGSAILQLTDDPAPNAGSVTLVVLSGDGTRVAFLADTDPLGQNAAHAVQLFIVRRDGTGLAQLTHAVSGSPSSIAISDDGSRLAFGSDGDLTGGNPQGSGQVFAVRSDGTGLRQLTNAPLGYDATAPALSGNGLTIAFQSNADLAGNNAAHQDEIFAVAYDGTGLRQLTKSVALLGTAGAQAPSITDDGLTVFFHSNYSTFFTNFDSNYEIFRIKTDGTGLRALTSTLIPTMNFMPLAAGGGGRVAFYTLGQFSGGNNPDQSPELAVMDGNGGSLRQLSDTLPVFVEEPGLAPDGSWAAFVQDDRVLGRRTLWAVNADGSGRRQVADLGSRQPHAPQVASDGATIVYSASATGSAEEIFAIGADGSNARALTSAGSTGACQNPVSAGGVVAFDCDADLAGANADLSREVFAVNLDGTGLVQLTSGGAGTTSRFAHVDGSGWAVFESNADGAWQAWRVRLDGSGLERLTGDPAYPGRAPDIGGGGTRIVWASTADPLGTNPEHNAEVFAYEPATGTTRQLTAFASGNSGAPRLSADGRWTWFGSTAPVFEAVPGGPSSTYRVPFDGGTIARVDGLRAGLGGGLPLSDLLGGGGGLSLSANGERAAFSTLGNPTGGNPDLMPEVWLVDRLAEPRIAVSKGAPTVLRWDVESGPVRYDAVRGDVAALRDGAGGSVDLGAVTCLEDDSPDASTDGFGDVPQPAAGRAFFFVTRGSQGLADPGSYGVSSDGRERRAASGDCP